MARATPLVSENVLTYHTGLEDHTLPIGSPAWWSWLNAEHTTTFRYENARGRSPQSWPNVKAITLPPFLKHHALPPGRA